MPEINLQFLFDGSNFSITVLCGLASMLTCYVMTRWNEFLFGAAMVVTAILPLALN